jgi:hypothetical protein
MALSAGETGPRTADRSAIPVSLRTWKRGSAGSCPRRDARHQGHRSRALDCGRRPARPRRSANALGQGTRVRRAHARSRLRGAATPPTARVATTPVPARGQAMTRAARARALYVPSAASKRESVNARCYRPTRQPSRQRVKRTRTSSMRSPSTCTREPTGARRGRTCPRTGGSEVARSGARRP